MKPFCKSYTVKIKDINLATLDIKNLEELTNFEFHIFNINSLVYFNEVTATFNQLSLNDNEYLELKIELQNKFIYIQLIPLLLFSFIITFILISEQQTNLKKALIIIFILSFISTMYYLYQNEFSKKSKLFLHKLIN